MTTNFEAENPSIQQALQRREIMETSHKKTTRIMEMLKDEFKVHALNAQHGQHAALPLPKEELGLPCEIKLFLPNKKAIFGKNDVNHGQNHHSKANYIDSYDDKLGTSSQYIYEEVEKEELITNILERRATYFYMAFEPQEPVEGPADTLFIVRRSKSKAQKVFIRAHSQVLKRSNDAFNELIGYKPSMISTPTSMQGGNESGIQISRKKDDICIPSRMSMYIELIHENEKERKDKYLQAINNNQRENIAQDKNLQLHIHDNNSIFSKVHKSNQGLGLGLVSDNNNCTEEANQMENSWSNDKRHQSNMIESQNQMAKCQDEALQLDQCITLGLENMLGTLQDSKEPLVFKEFLDATQKFFQFPSLLSTLPDDLKVSLGQFVTTMTRFKNLENETSKPKRLEYEKGLESTFLGMVGRRSSKEMLGILDNISQGVSKRQTSKLLLKQSQNHELEGMEGKNSSPKMARTILERRKSHAYIENQQRRENIIALEILKNGRLPINHDKGYSPSFLERRKSKAFFELAKREDTNFQRKTSKAAIMAFEKRKCMPLLEGKTMAELQFSNMYDERSPYSPITFPTLKPKVSGNKQNNVIESLLNGDKSSQMEKARKAYTSSKGKKILKSHKDFLNMDQKPSEDPSLKYTRHQDKEEVVCFYKEEDIDSYVTSSSTSTSNSQPPPLPNDIEFVIEKLHWTLDILEGLMEFIYTKTIHIHCEEIPDIYRAASEILLSSLTDAINLNPISQYYRLAMVNDQNRKALLDLANQFILRQNYNDYMDKNEDFRNLKNLCEAFELNGLLERKPYTLLFETGYMSFRNLPIVSEGLHKIDGHMVLIMEDPREGTRLFEQNSEQDEYLTFMERSRDQQNVKQKLEMKWLGQWPAIAKTKNRDKAWKVYLFDFPNLENDIPLKNFVFYKYITSRTMMPLGNEEFSVRLVCGLLICPILYKALRLAFPELSVVVGRGAGYYLGGETHGNNVTMIGYPLHLLQACRSIPRHMIGRTVLRVACPRERTFVRLWKSTNRFGVDVECNVLYFLKPLIQIQRMLESWHDINLDMHANYLVTHPREMVALVEPHDPF